MGQRMLRFLVATIIEIRRRRQAVKLVEAVRQLIADIHAARADGALSAEEILTIGRDLFRLAKDLLGIA